MASSSALSTWQLHAAARISRDVPQHLSSVHRGRQKAVNIVDRLRRLSLRRHRLHPVAEVPAVELVRGDVAIDVSDVKVQHDLICLGGPARRSNKQVNMFLDDLCDRRNPCLICEEGRLRYLKGLAVCIKQPFESLRFDFRDHCYALAAPSFGITPAHHERRRSVFFEAFADACHTKMLRPCRRKQ